ncbi:hypothetical protein FJY93_01175 [Candidatus Kaiserbacteria bacterium]|nr:hypothetical protein [Candidatus Kaiserbacteria bacterium]
MNNTYSQKIAIMSVGAIFALGGMIPSVAFAQYDYYDTSAYGYDGGSYDGGCCSYDYYDTSAYNDYYDTSAYNYDYYDTSAYNDYYDTSAYNYDYYDTSAYNDYYDTSYPDYGFGGYNYGNYASPMYSYTPSYGGIGGFGGYGGYGGYATGGGYFVDSGPIPTWPINTGWPSGFGHSMAGPVVVGTPSGPVGQTQTQSQSQGNTQTQSNPISISITPSTPGIPSNQTVTQNTTASASTGPINNSTSVGPIKNTTTNTNTTGNNTNTITVNGQPITITNTNINNNPAPVFQTPIQQLINYTFPANRQAPTCTISVSSSYYNSYSNSPVTLSWSSTNAYTASISPNVGSVNPNGSTTVYPVSGTTIYTMTVYGEGGTGTCQTQVVYQAQPVYQPPVYVPQPPVYVPPQVPVKPYVSLSQIPYTGFDFGPVGNGLYWAALLSFAIAAAYLAVYYKGGFALALGTAGSRRAQPAKTQTAATAVAEKKTSSTPSTVLTDLPTREVRNATSDTMVIAQAHNADEMPRIFINRA